MTRTVFHIDANSAYLAWEAVYRLQHGSEIDLRTVPSVVGGDEKSRHGIVLAKSIPAKKYSIQTGETLYSARLKCPQLVILPPNFRLYLKCSNAMASILREYSPQVQRYSVDECFLEYSHMEAHFGDPVKAAHAIKDRIREELGFTVNIGISTNKLLAKMGGDLSKPDKVHTLYPAEIQEKMWPLPVEDLFMVGRATAPKLNSMGIRTIGDLARCDVKYLESRFKSHGAMIWRFANGIEDSAVQNSHFDVKGIGNSTTTSFDVDDLRTAEMFLLSLSETVGTRLRESGFCCSLVSIGVKTSTFRYNSHQRKLYTPTDSTDDIYSAAKQLFREMWHQEPIRHFGVRVSDLSINQNIQLSIFQVNVERNRALNKTIDDIRNKYGARSIFRAAFAHSPINPLSGGVGDEEYPMMSSIL